MQPFTQPKHQAPAPDLTRRRTERNRRMKNSPKYVSLALTVLSILGLAVPGRAQQASPSSVSLVPFKFTYLSAGDSITIPVNPPIQPTRIVISGGQSDLLGPFT